jgi:hypothetical protein
MKTGCCFIENATRRLLREAGLLMTAVCRRSDWLNASQKGTPENPIPEVANRLPEAGTWLCIVLSKVGNAAQSLGQVKEDPSIVEDAFVQSVQKGETQL